MKGPCWLNLYSSMAVCVCVCVHAEVIDISPVAPPSAAQAPPEAEVQYSGEGWLRGFKERRRSSST